MPSTTPLAADDCYLALKARDARFDGSFFTGVTSTGIYCRPVCSVRTPRRENCLFFRHAAQAETAGFRPCLRCRPELAPNLPLSSHWAAWSAHDASSILAHQAAGLLDDPAHWAGQHGADQQASRQEPALARLAERLGVSDRHVRRIFEAHFGVSPLQYLQTRRLLTAKQLLADTALPITQVALMSGFQSVRRFNAAFAAHYRLKPSELRRQGMTSPGYAGQPATLGSTVRLGYRPPYDVPAMMGFFSKRAIDTLELIAIDARSTWAIRTFGLEVAGKSHVGWLRMEFDEARSQLVLTVSDSLREVLPHILRRARAMFDLDADPAAINSVLHSSFPSADGLRVPGALDGFELAVRAVLGQQITVAAARTLAQRLVERFGAPLQTPWPELNRLFPTAGTLAGLDATGSDALGQLGIVRQRQAAIIGIARAVQGQGLCLQGGADMGATVAALKALPGIGDWTAQYIAMRALRWPDAFPAGDVALHKALGVQGGKQPARDAESASAAWKPWRSYAVIRVWSGAWAGAAVQEASTSAGQVPVLVDETPELIATRACQPRAKGINHLKIAAKAADTEPVKAKTHEI